MSSLLRILRRYPNAFIAEMVIQAGKKGIPDKQVMKMFQEGWNKDAIKDYVSKYERGPIPKDGG